MPASRDCVLPMRQSQATLQRSWACCKRCDALLCDMAVVVCAAVDACKLDGEHLRAEVQTCAS
jgi:hypothetical protein